MDSDADASTKLVQKPSKKVADLLKDGALAPGIQKPSDDWAVVVVGCVDEYVFVAEIGAAEALEPQSLAEAKSRPDWLLWEKAVDEEMKSLQDAGTWEVVEMPKDVNIIGSKWVFKAKKDAAGAVVRYKAQLITQGFLQVPGVNYFDTFAPVTRLASICTVLAFAAAENYETGQIDIKSAYLNGELTNDEVIFMKQAPGYEVVEEGKGVLVYRLRKSLCGLKQAGRCWYQKLVDIMSKLGFERCEGDQAVFYRRSERVDVLIVVLVHVDDCMNVGKSQALIDRFKVEITKSIDITDMGSLHWILGIKVRRIHEERKILLSQKSYIDSILQHYGFEDLKPISTPMDPVNWLTSAQSPSTTEEFATMRNVPYHEAVGLLMYATLGTRPDICYAVQTVSHFNG